MSGLFIVRFFYILGASRAADAHLQYRHAAGAPIIKLALEGLDKILL